MDIDLLTEVINVAISQANLDLLVVLRKECTLYPREQREQLLLKFDLAVPDLSTALGSYPCASFIEFVKTHDRKSIKEEDSIIYQWQDDGYDDPDEMWCFKYEKLG